MPIKSTHPCDHINFAEFYNTDLIRDAFYSKPNVLVKSDYTVGISKKEKALLQVEISKRYNANKSRRSGYAPIPKWTWYSIRYREMTYPMVRTGEPKEYESRDFESRDTVSSPPSVSLKRSNRVRRNKRPSRLRAFAKLFSDIKETRRADSIFSLPLNLHDWMEMRSLSEETALRRGVLKRENEVLLDKKRMELMRCSRKEFLVEGMA